MRRAIDLARLGAGLVSPNPLVGAVVVDASGEVVGEGAHLRAGEAHAEVIALAAAGDRASGATLHVSLEPCAHFGRTPPCADAIIAAGIRRVVVAARDPNPIVDGRGIARLRAAGIEVEEGVLREDAERLNRAFTRHVTTGLPLVTWKVAASLDGKVAAADGSSRWITGEAAREDAHRLRAEADAILVGSGTALADDPALTVRLPGYAGDPVLRVLVDSRGRVPGDRRLFDAAAPTFVATTASAAPAARDAWRAAGAEVVEFPDADGRVRLPELLAHLGKRDVQSVLLECGPALAWAMVAADLVDRVVVHTAPILLGGAAAPGVLGGEGFAPVGAARRLVVDEVRTIGDDIRVEAHVHRDR
ncbi:MAG: bifunctional diaminohydroxyphosphoribosylaminopyrimidine deaminase/5-amino-6-(5-phosphoribosylamino)uracil reductase RibD [Actinomycetota bacterium]